MKSLLFTILSIVTFSFGFISDSQAQCFFEIDCDPIIFSCTDTELTANCEIIGADPSTMTFLWVGPNGFVSNLQNPVFINDPNNYGIYTLTVTDVDNCSFTIEMMISGGIDFSINITEVSCNGETDGSIICFPENYDYQWNIGVSGSAITNLAAGEYTVTVTDLDGCTAVSNIVITEPDFFFCNLNGNIELSCLNPNVDLSSVICNGGVPPFAYNFSNGGDGIVYSPGIYGVTITDSNGCSEEIQIFISEDTETNCGVIEGTITIDDNEDCIFDIGEQGFANILVEAVGDNIFYAMTDAEGNYSMDVLAGDYEVTPIIPNNGLWEACEVSQNVTVIDDLDIVVADFVVGKTVDCPLMFVEISTPFLRRCFDGNYVVTYCNYGTEVATDATIQITLPSLIEYLSSSVSATDLGNGIYEFSLGDVGISECGSFNIQFHTSCDAVLGQTLCVEAQVFPDENCIPTDPNWSGANIEIDVSCGQDEITFQIKNTGTGNMLQPSEYIVFEDGVMLMSSPGTFQLAASDLITATFPANGSTYIIQANQVPFHPSGANLTLSFEACGLNGVGEFSTGFINQFPLYENNYDYAIDCKEVIGAWDPNDKQAFPKGYADEHYIERGQDLEYLIRFQNTGTDTAFNIIVEDILSEHLDITTLRTGASSHPFNLEILGSDTLHFVYENIMLPDSNVNEVLSHGFIQFFIAQKEDLPLETVIENKAGIYFDFNEAVITNTVFHTIGMDFYPTQASEVFLPNLELNVYPNPFEEQTNIQLKGVKLENAALQLFNLNGQLLSTHSFKNNNLLLRNENLNSGIYFYKIETKGELVATGKLVVK